MIVAVCIVVAVLVVGLATGLAIVQVGSWLSTGSGWRIRRARRLGLATLPGGRRRHH